MANYNEQFLDHLMDLFALIFSPMTLKWCALLTAPTLLTYYIGSGYIFAFFFIASCFLARSARLGGIVGWYIVTLGILFFFVFPETGHYIDAYLRAPARATNVSDLRTSVDAIESIPDAFGSKLFIAILFGVRGGLVVGLGIGMLGRMTLGRNPGVQ